MFRSFINYIFAPLVIIISGLLSFPITSDYLKATLPTITLWLSVFVIISSVLNYYFNQLKLFNEHERTIEKMRITRPILRELSNFLQPYKIYNVSIHILIPERQYFCKLEPKSNSQDTKFNWVCNVFKPKWQSGRHIHNDLKMTTNQGYIGAAYKAGASTGVKFGVVNQPTSVLPNFNFTDKQKALLQGLVMVACCAIPNVNDDEKPLGVVSIDSYMAGSEILITDNQNLANLSKALEDLAEVLGDTLKDYYK